MASKKVSDLPESTSINKQITYGKLIAEHERFREKHGENNKVYNSICTGKQRNIKEYWSCL